MAKPKRTKKRAGKLTYQQEWAFMIGEDPWKPAFKNEDEKREAWFAHRDQLYRSGNVGTRCVGWWLFEAPDGKPRLGEEGLVYLIECGELKGDEAAELRKAGEQCGSIYWPPAAEEAWQARLSREADDA